MSVMAPSAPSRDLLLRVSHRRRDWQAGFSFWPRGPRPVNTLRPRFSSSRRSQVESFPRSLSPRRRGAGIYSASHWKCATDELESRWRGNDQYFERDHIRIDTSTQRREALNDSPGAAKVPPGDSFLWRLLKNSAKCHPEEVAAATDEGSLFLLDPTNTGVLRYAQNDMGQRFSATC